MFEFLDKLRAKSPFVRQQVAIAVAGAFSLVVFFMWVGTWGVKNDPLPIANSHAESPGTVLLDTITELKDGGVDAWKGTISAVRGIPDESLLAGTLESAPTDTTAASLEVPPSIDAEYDGNPADQLTPPDPGQPQAQTDEAVNPQ